MVLKTQQTKCHKLYSFPCGHMRALGGPLCILLVFLQPVLVPQSMPTSCFLSPHCASSPLDIDDESLARITDCQGSEASNCEFFIGVLFP